MVVFFVHEHSINFKFGYVFMTVKCIRIKYLQSRKIFVLWVFVPLRIVIMDICLFLRYNKICQMMHEGYICSKIFYSWNSVTLDFEEHICQIMSFEDFCCAMNNFFPKKKFILYVNYDQK